MKLRVGLDVWRQYLCVFTKVFEEGIAAPATHDFHHLEGHSLQEVVKGCTDSYAVTLEGVEASLFRSRGYSFDEGRFGEGSELVSMSIREEVVLL